MAQSLQRIVRGLPAKRCIVPMAVRAGVGQRNDSTRAVGVRHFASVLKVTDLGGESITDGALGEWNVKVGDFVRKGQVVVVIETDKVAVDVVAEVDGVVKEIHAQEEDTVEVGHKLATIEPGEAPAGAAPATEAAAGSVAADAGPAKPDNHGAPLTGLRLTFARLRAKRLGLPDPLGGDTKSETTDGPAVSDVGAIPEASGIEGRFEHRVPISRMRNFIMSEMKQTRDTAALLSTFQEMDMSAVQALEDKYKDLFQKTHESSFSYLSMIVKASAQALMEEPGVNAVIDDKEAVYRDYVDIAVPIHSPRGVVSCVLRDVQSMSVLDIERGIADLTAKAAQDELTIEDVSPCTFAIRDDHGMLGTGLISHPTSASMGINAISLRPVAVGKKVEARPVMFTSLTYDHRQIDGREAVTFLASVRNKIEDPARMLMGL